jgi:hypothetical protein
MVSGSSPGTFLRGPQASPMRCLRLVQSLRFKGEGHWAHLAVLYTVTLSPGSASEPSGKLKKIYSWLSIDHQSRL